jgi:hypothetical protein
MQCSMSVGYEQKLFKLPICFSNLAVELQIICFLVSLSVESCTCLPDNCPCELTAPIQSWRICYFGAVGSIINRGNKVYSVGAQTTVDYVRRQMPESDCNVWPGTDFATKKLPGYCYLPLAKSQVAVCVPLNGYHICRHKMELIASEGLAPFKFFIKLLCDTVHHADVFWSLNLALMLCLIFFR